MTEEKMNFSFQFSMNYEDYIKRIDLSDWFRYFFIVKELIRLKPKNILEIGAGNEIVKNCLLKIIKEYKVMDINQKLKPDILSDIREFRQELKEKFDCVICAEVLEHIPFSDLERSLTNIYAYLVKGGKAIITIPHRRARVMIITPLSYEKPVIITLPFWLKGSWKSFYRQIIRKKIWIDPHHYWEIGDGKIEIKNVEIVMKKVGFKIEKFNEILQADFWVLNKK